MKTLKVQLHRHWKQTQAMDYCEDCSKNVSWSKLEVFPRFIFIENLREHCTDQSWRQRTRLFRSAARKEILWIQRFPMLGVDKDAFLPDRLRPRGDSFKFSAQPGLLSVCQFLSEISRSEDDERRWKQNPETPPIPNRPRWFICYSDEKLVDVVVFVALIDRLISRRPSVSRIRE